VQLGELLIHTIDSPIKRLYDLVQLLYFFGKPTVLLFEPVFFQLQLLDLLIDKAYLLPALIVQLLSMLQIVEESLFLLLFQSISLRTLAHMGS
jgi:hypothetical protein